MRAQKLSLLYFHFLLLLNSSWIKTDSFDVDNPFPSSVYKQVLDTSMQIWQEIELMNTNKLGLDPQTADDLLVGRLLRLQQLIQQLPQYQILDEDAEYLQFVFAQMRSEYRGNNTIMRYLLQSNYARISAR